MKMTMAINDPDHLVKEQGKNKMTTLDIPDHLVEDILSRTPSKSLLLFQFISKAWCSSINDPKFIKLHLQKSKERGATGMIFVFAGSCMFYVDPETPPDKMVRIDVRSDFLLGDMVFDILGSCNGLLCLASKVCDENVLMLFNPSTRKGTSFPQEKNLDNLDGYGLFCDPSEFDYKLLTVSNYEASVYSFDDNTWKTNGTIPYDLSFAPKGILVNGALHWFAPECALVAFNPSNEKFVEIPHPENIRLSTAIPVLVELAGNLVFLCEYETMYVAWSMKEYGVEESWSKLFDIDRSVVPFGFSPIHATKNGDIFVNVRFDGQGILTLEKDQLENLYSLGKGNYIQAITFVDSLCGLKTNDRNSGKLAKVMSPTSSMVLSSKNTGRLSQYLPQLTKGQWCLCFVLLIGSFVLDWLLSQYCPNCFLFEDRIYRFLRRYIDQYWESWWTMK